MRVLPSPQAISRMEETLKQLAQDLGVANRVTFLGYVPDEELPAILAYVRDKDLWRWELPHSRAVAAALPRDHVGELAGAGLRRLGVERRLVGRDDLVG